MVDATVLYIGRMMVDATVLYIGSMMVTVVVLTVLIPSHTGLTTRLRPTCDRMFFGIVDTS